MAQPNQISLVLDDATLTEIRHALAILRAKLVPSLKTLSMKDKRELPKMGDRTAAFVQKAFEYTLVHPDLVPAFLDCQEFRIDLEAREVLLGLERELAPVSEALEDSIFMCGSEAYQAALLFYNNVKMAKKVNLASAAAVYDDLSAQFPGPFPKKL